MTAEDLPVLVARPRRIVIYAGIAATVMVGAMIVVGVLLRSSADGVSFRTADQVGLIGVGLLFGGLIMVAAARPKLKADRNGVEVRNMVGRREYEWAVIHRISFPEGAQWPVLELADDESYPVIAIQAMDRRRALESLTALRTLFDRYAVNRPEQSEQARRATLDQIERAAAARPLGRLELQDLHRRPRKDRHR